MNQHLKHKKKIILNLILHLAKLLISGAPRIKVLFSIQLMDDIYQLNKEETQDMEK